jgi:hypothetical protein
MVFRDEREALSERAEALEKELAEARAEIDALKGQAPPKGAEVSRLFGAPLRVELVREIDGEIGDETKEILVEELRRRYGRSGQVSTIGRSVTWSIEPTQAQPSRDLSVSIRSRNGRTVITANERNAQLAGGLFGGLGGGVGVGLGLSAAVALGLKASWALGLLVAVALFLISWVFARAIFVVAARARRAELAAAVEALATIAKEDDGRLVQHGATDVSTGVRAAFDEVPSAALGDEAARDEASSAEEIRKSRS